MTLSPAARRQAGSLLQAAWIVLLIVPAFTTLPPLPVWEPLDVALLVMPVWLAWAARLLVPRRAFFLVTLPIVLLGILCMGAAALRGVDLLELVLQWRSYSRSDVVSAWRPQAAATLLAFGAAALLCAAAWRWAPERAASRRDQLVALVVTLGAAAALPAATWLRIWPLDAILVAASAPGDSRWLADRLFPRESTANPRDPKAAWNASRLPGAPARETVVLIIGESVRSDYLRECHGPARVRPAAPGALVACDVTSGADQTAASVPLLVSREMPGHAERISRDATFAHALSEAGFETHWYGVQGARVAWSDALFQDFPNATGLDARLLEPPLVAALDRPAPLKAVVLHAYGAHEPYCDRYDPKSHPYEVNCNQTLFGDDKAVLPQVKLTYANAVDANIGFVNDVIAELDKRPQPAFLVFTPDHAEGLLDDGRAICGHGQRHPTRWETQVPVIFWANAAWRATHAAQWARLEAQVGAPLMHADLVPTLLDAAGVRYDEPRPQAVDLLAATVPQRRRTIQVKLGETVGWETLVQEARDAGPLR